MFSSYNLYIPTALVPALFCSSIPTSFFILLKLNIMDQLATYYSFLRNSIKWWRKVMFWMLEVAVVNTYILYTSTLLDASQQPHSHLQFRRELVLELVAHRLQLPAPDRPGCHVDLSLKRLRPVPHFSEESDWRRD